MCRNFFIEINIYLKNFLEESSQKQPLWFGFHCSLWKNNNWLLSLEMDRWVSCIWTYVTKQLCFLARGNKLQAVANPKKHNEILSRSIFVWLCTTSGLLWNQLKFSLGTHLANILLRFFSFFLLFFLVHSQVDISLSLWAFLKKKRWSKTQFGLPLT